MKIVKVGALALAMMFAAGCTVEAKGTYNPIKLIKKFDKKVLQANMEFYRDGAVYVIDQVKKVFGLAAGKKVDAVLRLPYRYPTATIITMTTLVAVGVIVYKKYRAKKEKQTIEEDGIETIEEGKTVVAV